MDKNELKHYGVLGMKWGRRKGRSSVKSSTDSSNKKKSDDSSSKKAKIAKGTKAVASILAVSGGIALGAFMIKRARETGHREGIIAAQQEARMFRRAAAAKGVATRAANKAIKVGKTAVNSSLSSIGKWNVQDIMSMVR